MILHKACVFKLKPDGATRRKLAKACGRTRFHKKFRDEDSIRCPQGFKVDEARRQVYLPKIGWVGYRRSRFINGKIKSVTVMRKADGWYVSILTERETAAPVHPRAGSGIGVDEGVKKTAALSDGTICLPVDAFRKLKEKLARLQQRLKRMVKFSRNWRKQQKIARLHKKIADTRRDHLQKLTTDICKNHAVVYREGLRIRNMTASAKGTLEEPGKNVEAEERPQERHPRSGMGDAFQHARSKDIRARRGGLRRSSGEHEPHVSRMRGRAAPEPSDAGALLLPGLRL